MSNQNGHTYDESRQATYIDFDPMPEEEDAVPLDFDEALRLFCGEDTKAEKAAGYTMALLTVALAFVGTVAVVRRILR